MCVFGCKCSVGRLEHYLTCDRLWQIVDRHGNLSSGTSVLSRIGLRDPTVSKFKSIALAFTIYHALKLSHREIVEQSLESQNFEAMTALKKQLAVTHNNILVTLIPK